MRRFPLLMLLLLASLSLVLAACGGDEGDNGDDTDSGANGADSGAVEVIERYLQARVDSDEDLLYEITCAELEAQIPMQAQSFAAVEASLQDMACALDGSEGDYTLVTCEGAFFIEYGEEQQDSEIPLETYRAVEEGGEWKACGEGGAGVDASTGPTPTPPE